MKFASRDCVCAASSQNDATAITSSILQSITSPQDLKSLSIEQLEDRGHASDKGNIGPAGIVLFASSACFRMCPGNIRTIVQIVSWTH